MTTTTSSSFNFNINLFDIIFIVLALYIVITGIIQMASKKLVGDKKTYKLYTAESIKKYAVTSGVMYIIAGLVLLAKFALEMFCVVDDKIFGMSTTIWTIIELAVFVLVVVFGYFIGRKQLVKLQTPAVSNAVESNEKIADDELQD